MTTCGCSTHIALTRNIDPTRTKTQRDRFVADITKRFKNVARLIKVSVADNDCLGLREQPRILEAAGPGQFDFARSDQKIEAFMVWLAEQVESEIFTLTVRDRIGGATNELWANLYIDSAYKQGIRRGRQELRRSGVDLAKPGDPTRDENTIAFNSPIHADRVAVLYTRTFTELKGITDAMDQQISRILSEGILNGWSPLRIADALVDRVQKIGINRARMLARTEVIRAHHLATIQEYRNAGVLEVSVLAEFSTAGDGRVCPDCAALNGKVFTLDQIEGMIPVHPNCVTSDTVIMAPGITSVVRARYSGLLCEIITVTGVKLTVTPNHMLMTPDGLVMARFLTKGVEILYCSKGEGVPVCDPNDKNNPSRIDNIFNSLAESLRCSTAAVPVSPIDFHGDGISCKGHVDIIRTDSLLGNDIDIIAFEDRDDLKLQWGTIFDVLFSGSSFAQLVKRSFASPHGFIGFGRDELAFLRGALLHFKNIGIAPVPSPDSSLFENPYYWSPGDSELFSQLLDRCSRLEHLDNQSFINVSPGRSASLPQGETISDESIFNSISLRKSIYLSNASKGFPAHVKPVGIKNINFFHVDSVYLYDVETSSTGYMANGFLSSNCRCVALPALPSLD